MLSLSLLGLSLMGRSGTAPAGPPTVENQTAEFGDGTNARFQPINTADEPQTLTGTPTLLSGDDTGFTAQISDGGLWFGSGTGAPDGTVYRCTLTEGGTVDITVSVTANCSTFSTLFGAGADTLETAYDDAPLGSILALRAGGYNTSMVRENISRNTDLSAGWTGGSTALSIRDGNWTVMRPCAGEEASVVIGGIEINDNTNNNYLRLENLTFEAPYTSGTPGNISAIVRLFNGPYVAVTNCTIRHVTPATVFDVDCYTGILASNDGHNWIENNTLDSCFKAISGDYSDSYVAKNVVTRCLVDSYFIGDCSNTYFLGNGSLDKLYGYYAPTPIVSITTGSSTVIEVADTFGLNNNEIVRITGVGGEVGAVIDEVTLSVTAVTATTVTVPLDTSGRSWSVADGGDLQIGLNVHGDHWQFAPNGVDGTQDSVVFMYNYGGRRNPGHTYGPDGQCVHMGLSGGTSPVRRDWIFGCNVFDSVGTNGWNLQNALRGFFFNNAIVPHLGGFVSTNRIVIDGLCADITFVDNLAYDYVINGSATFVLQDNNADLATFSDPTAQPFNSGDLAILTAALESPPTAMNQTYDPRTAYLTKAIGGTFSASDPLPGIVAGVIDFANQTFTDPRGLLGPDAFGDSDWSLTAGDTEIDVTITSLPTGTDDIEYRVDGGTWTSSGGTVSFTITGLTNGTEYDIEIRPVDAEGDHGAGSSIKSATPAAAASTFTTSATGPRFQDQDGGGSVIDWSGSGTLFFSMKGTPAASAGNSLPLFMRSNGIRLERQSGGNVRLSIQDGTGANILVTQDMGYTWADEAEVRIALSIDMANETVRFWADGVLEYENTSIGTNNGALRSNREVWFLADNLASNQFVGDVEYLRLWAVASTDGTDPVATPYKEITGPAATANADPWKEGDDAT